MKKFLMTTLMLMTLSACSGNSGSITDMYSGNEGGSWLAGSICNHCGR
jgi:hypothetical protein